MDETLRQLGGLLLGSIPTVICMLVVYGAYTALVHRPLERVLAERHSKTEGAIEKARADIAAAESRTAEYEQRVREARMSVFKSQESRRQKALQARSAAVAEARKKGQAQVEEAMAAIRKDKQAALAALQAEGSRLAEAMIHAVLASTGAEAAR